MDTIVHIEQGEHFVLLFYADGDLVITPDAPIQAGATWTPTIAYYEIPCPTCGAWVHEFTRTSPTCKGEIICIAAGNEER